MKKPRATPSFRPLYEQIKILLTHSLVAGEWKPGEAIPSEIELAERFRVSQGTVRKAIDELAAENILMRRQGKGTFVASHSEPAYQYRFLRVHARLRRAARTRRTSSSGSSAARRARRPRGRSASRRAPPV